MTTFDSTKASLNDLLREIREGKIQLPDFQRFDTLRTRLSAAYKGINVLVLREGAKDWFWKATIQELDTNEVALDIHHIFPRDWCEKHGIARERYDSILNKTPISYKANRKIGGDAPSAYIPRTQTEKQVGLADDAMDDLLASHALEPALLRSDDFDHSIEDRRRRLVALIERAILEKLQSYKAAGQTLDLFGDPQVDIADRLDAYEHKGPWTNRMILGDSLQVMNSLLEYEGLGGQVQLIYIDPRPTV